MGWLDAEGGASGALEVLRGGGDTITPVWGWSRSVPKWGEREYFRQEEEGETQDEKEQGHL